MPQLLAAAIAEIVPAAAGTAFTVGTTAVTYATIASYTLIAAGSYYAMKSSMSMPDMTSLAGSQSNKLTLSRNPVDSRRIIYGTCKSAGTLLFANTTSLPGSTKNEDLNLMIAVAGHEVDAFRGIWANDVKISDDGQNIYPESVYSTNLWASHNNGGEGPTYTADLLASSSLGNAVWDSNHKCQRIATQFLILRADAKVYPNGIPNFTFLIDGRRCYDPRNTNTAFTKNPALIIRDYLKDLPNGLKVGADEIDEDSFISAANSCDELVAGPNSTTIPRYECNLTFNLNEKPADILAKLLNTCYGKLIYTNGQFKLKVGVWYTPVVTLNESDLRGGISCTTKSTIQNSFNSVKGIYTEADVSQSYMPSDFVPYTSSYYINEDNGVQSFINFEFDGVTNASQARRLAKLHLLDTRQDLTCVLPLKITGLQLIPGDTVTVNNTRFGWENKTFEVQDLTIQSDLGVDVTLKESVADIFEWDGTDADVTRDLSPNSNLPTPFNVPDVTNFTAIEDTIIDVDGTVWPAAHLAWAPITSSNVYQIEINFRESESIDWNHLVTLNQFAEDFETSAVEIRKPYEFRIRNFNYIGAYGSWASASLYISGSTSIPSAPTGSASGGSGSFTLTWTTPNLEPDYKHTKIWFNNTNNLGTAAYRGYIAGSTWNTLVAQSGSYYAWLQNVNTSGLMSATSSVASAFVAGISSGETGPSGSKGDTYYSIYKRSTLVPATPTGNLVPSGWSLTIPADNGDALWVSNGLISGADGVTLIGNWSSPQRLSGKASYYQDEAPVSGSNASPLIGDLWFDTNDAFKVYRWNGTSWESVQDGNISPLSSSIVTMTSSISQMNSDLINVANGLIYATGSISNLYTQSYNLSSSYYAASQSFSSSISNINLTYATKDFAIAVAATSASVAYNSATGSAYAYTDNRLLIYATTSSAQTYAQTAATSSYNQATASFLNTLTTYATQTYATTQATTAASASFYAATGSSNAYTDNKLTTYASKDYAQSVASSTISASLNNNGGIISASVSTVAKATADLSGSIAGEYVVAVTGGNRVAGFKILSSTVSSSFDIVADKFRIYNSTNNTVTQSFMADANGVYIDTATIRSLDAGKITAGNITAAVTMSAAYIDGGTISGGGMYVNSNVGLRYKDDSGVFTITGGSNNGDTHGGQIDFCGNSSVYPGVTSIIAGNVANGGSNTGTNSGFIQFYAGGSQRGHIWKNGVMNMRVGYTVGNTASPDDFTKLAITDNFGAGNCLTYSGGTGDTGKAHRWVNSGNTLELMNLTTSGTLNVTADVYADNFISPSARWLKKNIRPFNSGLIVIQKLEVKTYDFIDGSKKDDVGLIADEAEKIIPNIVSKRDGEAAGIDYAKLTPFLIAAIQEQQAIIENLNDRLKKLENKRK